MDEDFDLFGAAALYSKELQPYAKIHFFKEISNDKLFVAYESKIHQIGFLDLTDKEKTLLEKVDEMGVDLMVNSKDISFSIDRLNLNRLTNADDDLSRDYHFVQVSNQAALVKYNQCYYFVNELLANDLRRYTNTYAKNIRDLAFTFYSGNKATSDVLQINSEDQTLHLKDEIMRRKRKFHLHFGPFEYNEETRAGSTRYVLDKACQFIRIDEHLVTRIKLETASDKIELKRYFTTIDSASAVITTPQRSPNDSVQVPRYAIVAEPTTPNENISEPMENVQPIVKNEPVASTSKNSIADENEIVDRMFFGLELYKLPKAAVPEKIKNFVREKLTIEEETQIDNDL